MKLPSQKIIIWGSILLALIIVVGTVKLSNASKNEPVATISTEEKKQIASQSQTDSDNDGLKDWEEVLWKTDPKNPDTDSDKTSDGAEVQQGRDPLKAGPDDKILSVQIAATSTVKSSLVSQITSNRTAKVAQDIFSQVVSYSQLGVAIPDDFQTTIAQNAIQKAVNEPASSDSLPPVTFRTSQNNSTDAIKDYGNQLANVLRHDPTASLLSGNTTDLNSTSSFSGFSDVGKNIESDVNQLKEIVVPSSFASLHQQILSNYQKTGALLIQIGNLNQDPISAIVAINSLEQTTTDFKGITSTASSFFKLKGVTFDPSEPGHIFN